MSVNLKKILIVFDFIRDSPSLAVFYFLTLFMPVAFSGCFATANPEPSSASSRQATPPMKDDDEFLIVDCLLPGQIRQLGRFTTYTSARRPTRTTTEDCIIRGGEYVAADRANYHTALKVWLDAANDGDPEAQYYVGTLYEKGPQGTPDYHMAAAWYRRAAEQGYSRAAINLGRLYEEGIGLTKNPSEALTWYARASGLDHATLALLVTHDVGNHTDIGTPKQEQEPTPSPDLGTQGPIIEILDPLLVKTRGVRMVMGRMPVTATIGEQRTITGRVLAPAGLHSIRINNDPITTEENGIFRTGLPILQEGQKNVPVDIVAIDTRDKRATIHLLVVPPTVDPPPPVPPSEEFKGFGNYHALVIGNDHYHHWPALENAIADATEVAALLQNRYGFQVTLLTDATRRETLKALNTYRKVLTEKDNLLIYYAGHGYLEPEIDRGYWIPIDAEHNDNSEWVLLPTITDLVQLIPAKHILIVADSCYSGKLTRTSLGKLRPDLPPKTRLAMLHTFAKSRVRTAFTSGGVAPVLDVGKGGHSIFANAFLVVLRENKDILETERLFWAVRARVTETAKTRNVKQVPTYSPIQFAGHEGLGDFIFVPQSS